jgi:putative protease
MKLELLAPAGDLDAAYAAFDYGADAVYLGLKRFSARAEAANFTPEELSEITAYAHQSTPRRSVFVAVNTLVLEDELDDAIEVLATASEAGVDAVIIQDLGMARLARQYFPRLALHASTQMAIHNVAGAQAARRLGFSRVTLARELTLDEVGAIVRDSGVDVETFIHGALCYAYSGLCLYSSHLRGRSGNRGRCCYPCRDSFEGQGGGIKGRFPFSMKDLALTGDVVKLRDAGVFSFKIEGRKKSALYVAAVTSYYRQLLDNRLAPAARREAEEDIKTIFSRPWTDLYLKTPRNRQVTDAEVVGHRGAPIGVVQEIIRQGREEWVRFKTQRRIERHDGIQTDVPGQGRPFGFPVDQLRLSAKGGKRPEDVFEAPAHTVIDVALPPDHPEIEPGAPLYCSSSQEVKQRYRFTRPKPGAFRVRVPVRVTVEVKPHALLARGSVTPDLVEETVLDGVFEPSRDPGKIATAAREAFGKLGETRYELAEFTLANPDGLFIPVSLLNRLRRELVAKLDTALDAGRQQAIRVVRDAEKPLPLAREDSMTERWSLKVDRLDHLAAFGEGDWQEVDEVVVDIQRDALGELVPGLAALKDRVGAGRIRLALPLLTREWEQVDLQAKRVALQEAGWTRWEVAALCDWPSGEVTADWTLYVTNRSAARQLLELGVSRFTLSPEDGRDNMESLLGQFAGRVTVVVYQDTPLFISENCALAAMAGRCPAGAGCRESEREWESGSGESIRMIQQGCRTLAINQSPFCLSGRVKELRNAGARNFRADFICRKYEPGRVRELWQAIRQGHPIPGHEGNYKRGMR